MSTIRPISDLQDCLEEISKTAHESGQPVFLTKDGYNDMVLMSIEAFEHLQIENDIFEKLRAAELQAKRSSKRYSSSEVLAELEKITNVWVIESSFSNSHS